MYLERLVRRAAQNTIAGEERDEQRGEPGRVCQLQIVAVDPRKLVFVEHAGAVPDVLEAEPPGELGGRQQLFVRAGGPPDERQVVHERLRQVALLPELCHRRRTVPFGQRTVIGTEDEREVRERRCVVPERLVEQHLPRRVRHVVFPTHHVRDPHQRIVHDHHEIVGGQPVRSHEDGIADDVAAERDRTANHVVKRHFARRRHLEADDGSIAGGHTAGGLGRIEPTAAPHVSRWLGRGKRQGAIPLELLGSAETVVRLPRIEQPRGVRAVQGEPFRLAIRPVRPARIRPLVPREPHPAEIVEDARFRLACGALPVGILDAEHERALLPSCEQPVEERRTGVPDVEMTSRRGSEADTHGEESG